MSYFISRETKQDPAKYWKFKKGVPIKISTMNDNYIKKSFRHINKIEAELIEKLLEITRVKETLLLEHEKRNLEPDWSLFKKSREELKNIVLSDKVARQIIQGAKIRSEVSIGQRSSDK